MKKVTIIDSRLFYKKISHLPCAKQWFSAHVKKVTCIYSRIFFVDPSNLSHTPIDICSRARMNAYWVGYNSTNGSGTNRLRAVRVYWIWAWNDLKRSRVLNDIRTMEYIIRSRWKFWVKTCEQLAARESAFWSALRNDLSRLSNMQSVITNLNYNLASINISCIVSFIIPLQQNNWCLWNKTLNVKIEI